MLFCLLAAIVLAIIYPFYEHIAGYLIFFDPLRTHDGSVILAGLRLCLSTVGAMAIASWLVSFARPTKRIEQDRGPPSDQDGVVSKILGALTSLVLGSFSAFVAGKAIVTGAIPNLKGKTILFSTHPGAFLFLLVLAGGTGLVLLYCAFPEKRRR